MSKPCPKLTVFVGLSGGVDSSVAAYLLLQAGYQVVGVYMKNWSQDIGSYQCPWRADYLAAKSLATFLDIPFLVFDFQTAYKDLVVDYMIEEYRQGYTPNPDIMCNQTIKFNLFLKTCLEQGADAIATGHYAKIRQGQLYRPLDKFKDQTYFLYSMPASALSQTLFPLGNLCKTKVRQMAQAANLPTADRPESMGLCFVGEVSLVEFLKHYIQTQPGKILDERGQMLGQHQGAIFYTLGQRRGLNIGGGGLPYYVIGKDMTKNEVYVSQNLAHRQLWATTLKLQHAHWFEAPNLDKIYRLRIRHGGALHSVQCQSLDSRRGRAALKLLEAVKAATAGQSAVVYDGDKVIGGGRLV